MAEILWLAGAEPSVFGLRKAKGMLWPFLRRAAGLPATPLKLDIDGYLNRVQSSTLGRNRTNWRRQTTHR